MKNIFAIAYMDENGNGFTENEPWIDGEYSTIPEIRERAVELFQDGMTNIIPFEVVDEIASYSWDYVKRHRVKGWV